MSAKLDEFLKRNLDHGFEDLMKGKTESAYIFILILNLLVKTHENYESRTSALRATDSPSRNNKLRTSKFLSETSELKSS